MREKTEMGEVVGGGDEGVVVCLEEKKTDGEWCRRR